jgi:hypothetical protein
VFELVTVPALVRVSESLALFKSTLQTFGVVIVIWLEKPTI